MIAKYKNRYFCVDLTIKPVEIWRYDAVEGFEICIDDDLVYYSKFLDINEIDEIFDVGFSALWNGEWCGFDISFDTNRIEIYSNSPTFAEKYKMEEIERCAYKLIVSIDDITEFKVVYRDSDGIITREESISLDELKVLYKQFYTDLLPH